MAARSRRQRGQLEWLPSGSCRVRVYAGIDPISDQRHYLEEVVRARPSHRETERAAEEVRVRFINQVNERRNPRSKATVHQLLDRWLEVVELEPNTRQGYVGKIEKHIRPMIGQLQAGRVDAEVIETLYARLRQCREHCKGRRFVEHRTTRSHECDERCQQHECRPLAAGSIRVIHSILKGAFRQAVRWKWIASNPMDSVEPPPVPAADPQPPSADEAARVVTEAWKDPDWGTLIWLKMVTGPRRGEIAGLRRSHLDLNGAVVTYHRAIGQIGGNQWEKDTKTHQRRRVALDQETVEILREHLQRCDDRAAAAGVSIADDAFVFSRDVDCATPLRPDSITQRYGRMAKRLGINTHIHNLRHYSATELISAGVDPRTVAGRLGHAGGGSTTLRFYSAWVGEADQRAALKLVSRMPRPVLHPDRHDGGSRTDRRTSRQSDAELAPYERVAVSLREKIENGALGGGDELPPFSVLAAEHEVSFGTVQRAVSRLRDLGLVDVRRGRRARVVGASAG